MNTQTMALFTRENLNALTQIFYNNAKAFEKLWLDSINVNADDAFLTRSCMFDAGGIAMDKLCRMIFDDWDKMFYDVYHGELSEIWNEVIKPASPYTKHSSDLMSIHNIDKTCGGCAEVKLELLMKLFEVMDKWTAILEDYIGRTSTIIKSSMIGLELATMGNK